MSGSQETPSKLTTEKSLEKQSLLVNKFLVLVQTVLAQVKVRGDIHDPHWSVSRVDSPPPNSDFFPGRWEADLEIGTNWVYRKESPELRRPREETAGAGNVLGTGRQKLGYEVAETLNLPLTNAYGRSRMINEMCCGRGKPYRCGGMRTSGSPSWCGA